MRDGCRRHRLEPWPMHLFFLAYRMFFGISNCADFQTLPSWMAEFQYGTREIFEHLANDMPPPWKCSQHFEDRHAYCVRTQNFLSFLREMLRSHGTRARIKLTRCALPDPEDLRPTFLAH